MKSTYELSDVLSSMSGHRYDESHPEFSAIAYTILVGYSLMIPQSDILVQIARDRLSGLFVERLLQTVDRVPYLAPYRNCAFACAHEMADHYVDQIIARNELASDKVKTYTTMIDSVLEVAGTRFGAQLSNDPKRYQKEWRAFLVTHHDEDTPTLLSWLNAPLQSVQQHKCQVAV